MKILRNQTFSLGKAISAFHERAEVTLQYYLNSSLQGTIEVNEASQEHYQGDYVGEAFMRNLAQVS
jgi:hypothetical protein